VEEEVVECCVWTVVETSIGGDMNDFVLLMCVVVCVLLCVLVLCVLSCLLCIFVTSFASPFVPLGDNVVMQL
jgi:hypothetical protein